MAGGWTAKPWRELRAGLSEGVDAGLERVHEGLLLLPTFNAQIATAVSTAVAGLFAPRVQDELLLEEAERDVGVAVFGAAIDEFCLRSSELER